MLAGTTSTGEVGSGTRIEGTNGGFAAVNSMG
jgi:hypothetical protein